MQEQAAPDWNAYSLVALIEEGPLPFASLLHAAIEYLDSLGSMAESGFSAD